MKEIELTRGQVALVDDDDYEILNQYKWHALFDKVGGGYYAKTCQAIPVGGITSNLMHRAILKVASDFVHVDHVNHNTLDNTRGNLRIATPSQNGANRKRNINNISGFKGVSWRNDRNKWVVNIKVNQRKIWIGAYGDIIIAARAYNNAAIKYFGEYALLNVV